MPPSQDAKLEGTKNILSAFSLTSYQALQKVHQEFETENREYQSPVLLPPAFWFSKTNLSCILKGISTS